MSSGRNVGGARVAHVTVACSNEIGDDLRARVAPAHDDDALPGELVRRSIRAGVNDAARRSRAWSGERAAR